MGSLPIGRGCLLVFVDNLRDRPLIPPMAGVGWRVHERAVLGEVRRRRAPTVRLPRVGAPALRGATTLEQQTLPMVILASFAALALVQVIVTW